MAKLNALVAKTTVVDADDIIIVDSEVATPATTEASKTLATSILSTKVQADITTWNVSRTTNNGVVTYYTATADTNVARGVALVAAVSETLDRDKIYVRVGYYDCNNILANVDNIYYYFEDGAIVNYTGTVNGAIFSDADLSQESVFNIDGLGTFIHAGNNPSGLTGDKEVFYFKQSGTNGTIRCKKMQSSTRAIVLSSTLGADDFTVYCDEIIGGTIAIDNISSATIELFGRRIYSSGSSCLELDGNGDIISHISEIQGTTCPIVTGSLTGGIYVYNAKIIVPTNLRIAENNATNTMKLYNCISNCDRAEQLEGDISVQNVEVNSGVQLTTSVSGTLTYIEDGLQRLKEKSADPADPAEGNSIIWQSDGTGAGDDGDIMIKITAGGVTKTKTIIDYSV